jgi:hypothetical protein
MPTHIDAAKQALYYDRDTHHMLTAFLSGTVSTGFSLLYTAWLPWAPLVLLPLVTWLVYTYTHIPLEQYASLRAQYDPNHSITTLWVPNGTQNYTVYYVVHYFPVGDVCRVTTQNPLEDD